jgi:heme/copper-type cytochrome/quinol oxidase subunit 2
MLFKSEWAILLYWSPLVALVVLLAAAAAYFLAPACGYAAHNRGLLLGAVWVLIAKIALVIFKVGVLFLQELENKGSSTSYPGPGSSAKSPGAEPIVTMLFFMLDFGLLVLALALFAGGLASLRREADVRPTARSFSRD